MPAVNGVEASLSVIKKPGSNESSHHGLSFHISTDTVPSDKGSKTKAKTASITSASNRTLDSTTGGAAAAAGVGAGGHFQDENIADFALEGAPPEIQHLFQFIDSKRGEYVDTLREAVAIRSISSWVDARAEVLRMSQWFGAKLKEIGCHVEVRKMGEQIIKGGEQGGIGIGGGATIGGGVNVGLEASHGTIDHVNSNPSAASAAAITAGADGNFTLPIPPVIFATLGDDSAKKTLLIYGHVDVLPAKREDGWEGEPFLLNDFHGQLYGRGATDDKGPLLGWIHAIQAYQQNQIELPVNIKFILEGMEECGSEGLAQLLAQQADKFLSNIDFVVVSDNYWLGKTKPCLTYGLRGLCYFFAQVEAGSKDLHSGVFGGTVYEALPDLIYLLNQLVDHEGNVMVPGIMDEVSPKTIAEEELYTEIDFNLEEYKDDMGVPQIRHPDDKTRTLMNRWRFPSLSIHGIQGAFHNPGARAVIPRKVIGKFSIRLVPNQTPEAVEMAVMKYLTQKWEERGSPNKFLCFMADNGIPPWVADPHHPAYEAARRAIATVYQTFPDMIRDGGYMQTVLMLSEVTQKTVVLLPMGSADDAAHYTNEKLDTSNYVEGTKVMASYFWELGKLKGHIPSHAHAHAHHDQGHGHADAKAHAAGSTASATSKHGKSSASAHAPAPPAGAAAPIANAAGAPKKSKG